MIDRLDRPGVLRRTLAQLNAGDVRMVTRLDRLSA
jgi:DNA invertase Pin-like site-specific DNA recombinase